MRGLTDIIFPPACVACGRVLGAPAWFCAACDEQVERLPEERCGACAEPGDFPTGRCPRCLDRPPPFVATFAPFAHEGPVARAIHLFKYEDHPELAAPLARLLAEEAGTFLGQRTRTICAIPLHRSRFVSRKYDQAELLARALAKAIGAPWREGLRRTRATNRQVGLSEEAREANVAGAFEADAGVRGESILLVDDVFTTGATARAAAAAVLAAGAASVEVLTLARAYTRP